VRGFGRQEARGRQEEHSAEGRLADKAWHQRGAAVLGFGRKASPVLGKAS